MKKPIFTEQERRMMYSPELEVAKLRFRREFERSELGQALKKIAEWLTGVLNKY